MATATRIYLIAPRFAEEGKPIPAPRLVRATTPAQAWRHLAREFAVGVAGQEDLVDALGKGAKVEDASAEPDADD
jgi:hypothetical protein